MFKVEHNVPDVYINKSRDFQLIARLYDLVFQSSRFSIDSLEYISDTNNCNSTILPLLGTKVGFFTNLNLPDDVYRKVISAFPYIIRYKGSLKCLQLIANLFSRIENTHVYVNVERNESDLFVEFRFNDYFKNAELLNDILSYVCPAGMEILSYRVVSGYASGNVVTTDNYRVGVIIQERINDIEVSQRGITGIDSNLKEDTEYVPEIGFTIIENEDNTESEEN